MSLLWWQNGRDIDWFSANLEKWIKPGATSSNPTGSQQYGGRYSKLKSCRLSKTCQTMMYIPQEPQPRDLCYEEQLARFQDDRAYKYSQRQSHYNSSFNYIRTSARRAYYKPETNEIVLADEYDKIQTIQRQNRTKNYDYLLLLQQFLKNQESKVKHANSKEDIGTMTSYLNNNIEQYEQTDQTMTLKQFLQEGIEKYEQENLLTLKEFLQDTGKANHAQRNAFENQRTDRQKESDIVDETTLKKTEDISLREFLQEGCDMTFSPTNPFANDMATTCKRANPFISITRDEDSNKATTDANDVSFEEFLRERQFASCQNTSTNAQKTNASPRPIQRKVADERPHLSASTRTQSADSNDKLSFDEFLKERRHHLSPKKSTSEEDKELSLEEFLKSEATLCPYDIKLGKSNEHKAKVKNINLKLSKSFNDRTNLLKENLIKKLTRNDYPSENDKKKERTEDKTDENKITLYEFLKEEEHNQTADIQEGLKNLQLRTKHDGETFYEINNNTPDIKVNDNFIQVETPTVKYSQYEHNKQVCACDNQLPLTGVYNQNYSQSQLLNNIDAKIEFVDRSYDYHRHIHQDDMSSLQQSQYRGTSKLLNTTHTQGKKSKTRTKPYNPPVGGRVDDGLYGPVWPSVLLTYDKVVSPHSQGYPNESYA